MKRKIYDELLSWKKTSKGKTALLIDGARRVGKSYIVEEFAKKEYKSYLLIDFSINRKAVLEIFNEDTHDLDVFFLKLQALFGVELYHRESLIIFDEVQLFPKARQLIKHLVKDNRYDYIETGSLLSLKRNVENILLPSEERRIKMYPMDFEEFLWALGDKVTFDYIKKCFSELKPLGNSIHRKILNDFRLYMLVGGMPQAVKTYVETKNLSLVDQVKKDIIELYRNDISKFALGYENRVLSIFDSIPHQLGKENKRFTYALVNENSRFRDYENAFMFLNDAMITSSCYNTKDPNIGLNLTKDYNVQKLYMMDTGLLVSLAFRDKDFIDNKLYKSILLDKLGINEGMLMENIVAQLLTTNKHNLFYYAKNDKENRENHMEIDFLITDGSKLLPIEVKSSGNKHVSLNKFLNKFSKRTHKGYVLYPKDVNVKGNVIYLPLYMASLL
ncbi:MAG: ATP-binding protein [Acholeplasmataceae bacterium]|nr:ATP-binding protein [Acholeplasmataceae bacterium]